MTDVDLAEEERLHDEWVASHGGRVLDGPAPNAAILAGLVHWPQFWEVDHTAQDWIAEPLLARGRGHAVVAPAKTGKSLLLLGTAAALASGREWLHRPAGNPIRVAHLDYEMTEPDLYERLTALGYDSNDDLSRLVYVFDRGIPPLDTREGGEAIVEFLVDAEVEYATIDSLARAVSGPENDADTVRAFYRYTGARLKDHGIGWVRADNTGHGDKSRARGSSGKTDDVDIEWVVKTTENGLRLTRRASRVSWVPERIDLRIDKDPLRYTIGPRGWAAGAKAIAEVLDGLGLPVTAEVRAAREALKQAGETASNDALNDAVRYRREVESR